LKQQRDLQRRRQEQLMKRRMMISLNDEPATPQPATPQGPSTPKPGTPSMNGGKGGGGNVGGGKGGGGGGGKMGSMGVNSHPFSPQQNNQYNPMVNPGPGSGNPPPGAVAAAQEVVDIATRQITPKPMVSFFWVTHY